MAPEMLPKHPHPWGRGCGKRGSGQMPPSMAIWQERPFLTLPGLPPISPERGSSRLAVSPLPPTLAFPYGLFTGPSQAGGECSLTLTAARELFSAGCPSSNQCLPRTTERASDVLVSTEPLLAFCETVLNLINNVKSLYRSQKCSF